jgi:hypothetical protein
MGKLQLQQLPYEMSVRYFSFTQQTNFVNIYSSLVSFTHDILQKYTV